MNNRNIIKWSIVAALVLVIALFYAQPARAATYEAKPGETADAFVLRIARSVEMEGVRLNAEVCGAIKTRDGVHVLETGSKGDNIQCTVTHNAGELLVHTHLPYMGTRFSPADYTHAGYMIRNGRVCFNDGERGTEAIVTKSGRRPGSACAAGQ